LNDIEMRWVQAEDPCMSEIDELRHVVLFRPYGLPRLDAWDDDGNGIHRLAAFKDGEVVGYGCLIERDDGAQIRQVSVSPHLQRSGVGTAVVRGLVARAIECGIISVRLDSRATAETFYQRLGFATVGGQFATGRTGLPHVRMEIDLSVR